VEDSFGAGSTNLDKLSVISNMPNHNAEVTTVEATSVGHAARRAVNIPAASIPPFTHCSLLGALLALEAAALPATVAFDVPDGVDILPS